MTPVGIAEIAQMIGQRRQTVAQWHLRGKLPEPRWRLAAGPLWDKADVERWMAERK